MIIFQMFFLFSYCIESEQMQVLPISIHGLRSQFPQMQLLALNLLVLILVPWQTQFPFFDLDGSKVGKLSSFINQLFIVSGEYGLIPGCDFLRLHSTYRHDLKIYASDEGRVQMTAAAFAKVGLFFECFLTEISKWACHFDWVFAHLLQSSRSSHV